VEAVVILPAAFTALQGEAEFWNGKITYHARSREIQQWPGTFEDWSLEFLWMLEFGAWNFVVVSYNIKYGSPLACSL